MTSKGIAYERLSKFVGRWNTVGKILATDTAPEIAISGTDTYEWLPGGFFLLHRVDVFVGDDENKTVEIVGYDHEQDNYTMRHYDNKGNSGLMNATYDDGHWTFLGDTLRFTGGFKRNDMEFSGIWEQTADGRTWTHFMDIKLTKPN
ncbi:DUF1579 family protein [Parapedobacter sp. DT-150]|uniref:DUF1579 family protein n=1 Tax=Parapedobacter sp. DT-150 TaxID=3396162 RepID=UPI003F1C76DA